MPKVYKNTHGFSVPEIAIIAVGVGLLILVGWVVYNHFDDSDSAVILRKQQYIDKYISGLNVGDYTSFGSSLYNQGYLTFSLYTTTQSLINSYSEGSFGNNTAYSKIICVDLIPKSYTYGTVEINSNGNTATLPIDVFTPTSISPTKYTADWLKNNGTWQLNNAECS
ncbi:MAG TPA: hypothetical protein VMR34_05640 [Candidatus Saccharimonadales bacterium]|nr:hypothetical protein [Candidatus Saccharimonadales bacterium]